LAVKVIRYAEDAPITKFILERAQNAESDPQRKGRLKDALERLAKLPQ
jgi:hypothetical protein